MANILMGRFFFYAQATVFSNIFSVGFSGGQTSSDVPVEPEVELKEVPILGSGERHSLKESDRITDLPGLDYDPGFEQFSGYLTVDEKNQRKIFYWYVESQNDPATDPVVLWTNGGPGCSGLLGLGTEHGPFYISRHGKFSPNPYSWNKLANMLYVEQPAGVGYSYSEKKSDYKTGDSAVAADNYEAILQFLDRFPERRNNPFYVSSESYGGHYMPQLTREILNRDVKRHINLKGMMVGNPYVDPYTNARTMFEAWYHHGLLPWPLYDKFVRHCRDPKGFTYGKCQDYILEMYRTRGKGINVYALDFPMCLMDKKEISMEGTQGYEDRQLRATGTSDGFEEVTISPIEGRSRRSRNLGDASETGAAQLSSQASQLVNHTFQAMASASDLYSDDPPFLPQEDHYRPCAEQVFTAYLNREDVVKALHANPSTLPWKECSKDLDYSKKDYLEPQMKVYKSLLATMDDGSVNLDILVFSGDDDSVCSLAGTQTWIWNLGIKADSRSTWTPWMVENQTAGFMTRFRLRNKKSSFTFVTVHGAGHEVPTYRPMEALELFRRYLDQDWS